MTRPEARTNARKAASECLCNIMLARWQTLNQFAQEIEESLTREPHDQDLSFLRAVCWINKQDRFDPAISFLREQLPIAANRLELAAACLDRIRNHEHMGQRAEAIALAQKLVTSLLAAADSVGLQLSHAESTAIMSLWPKLGRRVRTQKLLSGYISKGKISSDICMVIGMHRSGTSALTELLVRCGLEAPKDLMEMGEENPRGYWESTGIMEINNRLLKRFKSSWRFSPELPCGWEDSGLALSWQKELVCHWANAFSGQRRPVIKDPRFCLLLSGLDCLFEGEDASFTFIEIIRHPLEVLESLMARKNDAISREEALRLWCQSTLNTERHLKKAERIILSYEDLLRDPSAAISNICSRLRMPPLSATSIREIGTSLTPELRHQNLDALRSQRKETCAPEGEELLLSSAIEIYKLMTSSSATDAARRLGYYRAVFGVT